MDRRTLKFPFTLKSKPDWICPTCEKAPLRIRKGSFVQDERLHSRDHSNHEWEPEFIDYVYCCLLDCSNDKCKETVSSIGTGAVDWSIAEDDNGNQEQVYEDHFRPTFFQPALKLLQIPGACPNSVSQPIEDSFSLFFASPSAASNSVRMAIEALLTDLKVRRFRMSGGQRRFISLHQRIALLPGKFTHLKNMILAIKWLGNAGSHDGATAITLDDVMDSYELLEHILQEVYASKLRKLHKLANKVNKKKGPVGESRRYRRK